ncbi:MAG: ABC transporter ATP-binding protein/permease [Eggerthellales bacterium]|nr:ABC transporter ATP-binding protein/permease [Eggerthellales bacterium]
MLQVKNIRKSYTTGSFTQKALDDVSLTLRDNEFVAILGPSGSGKTTLLNIIGGLDHYDSGDLVIDGISTKQYKDRDWDAYRNNRIGFVFQSYNLIPHQTILANVELALTLSGISPEERKERATEALERVGLGQHINKCPNQLSGGQMQRVAIARALINDPEILLADEPTGALDSKTSVQIMDLLTEIASDRLVVMVTHNPELAEQYANRIVTLADGVIRSDTNPYNPTAEELEKMSTKKTRYTSMSLLTALSLSLNNLMTKKARTIMTAVAGSIGIIGIAAILALANGVNEYIANVEEETLSEYPLQITSSSFNLGGSSEGEEESSSASSASASMPANDHFVRANIEEEQIGVIKSISNMFGSIGSNDLGSLKDYFDSGTSGIEPYVNSIEYKYNVTPLIFAADTSNQLHQVNPDKSFAALGMGSGSSNGLMSMAMSTDTFSQLPKDKNLYRDSYEVLKGRWPENYNECVLVVSRGGYINDFMLYSLGQRDPEELNDMVKAFMNEEEAVTPENYSSVSFDTILNLKYKLVNAADFYEYDSSYNVWKDKSDDESYVKNLVDNGEDLNIVGIVRATPDARIAMLKQGINYPYELTQHVIEVAGNSQIVKDQIDNPSIDVITGTAFGEKEDRSDFDMGSLFSIDTNALSNAFKIDQSKMQPDMSHIADMQKNMEDAFNEVVIPPFDPSGIGDISDNISINPEGIGPLTTTISAVTTDYGVWLIQKGISDPQPEDFETFLEENPHQQEALATAIRGVLLIDDEGIRNQIGNVVNAYIYTTMNSVMKQISDIVTAEMGNALNLTFADLTKNMESAFSFDQSAFAGAFQMNMNADDLSAIMSSMMKKEDRTYDNNLKNFGYADLNKPYEVSIYPISFESKSEVINILDEYNAKMKEEDENKVINYTDIVGLLMTSVTEIVDMISMVLIAFVAISLIVSSIMIGVITYISVLERIKEIGILRAIGASKKDVSHIFNAETIIEGLISGVLGIVVTFIGCFIANTILDATGYPQVAQLPINAALILIVISVVLSFVAGLLPARSASKKDPVEALRIE